MYRFFLTVISIRFRHQLYIELRSRIPHERGSHHPQAKAEQLREGGIEIEDYSKSLDSDSLGADLDHSIMSRSASSLDAREEVRGHARDWGAGSFGKCAKFVKGVHQLGIVHVHVAL